MMRRGIINIGLILAVFSGTVWADSIFSTGGMGLSEPNPDARPASMGVLGIGLSDTATVGSINPALWASISISRVSAGVEIMRYYSRDHNNKDLSDQFYLPFTALGICLKPGYTLGFRFHPFTRMDTRYTEVITLQTDDEYKYEETYLLKGGVSVGSAIFAGRISDKIWLGGSADLIFGNLLTLWRVNFMQGGGAYGTYTSSDALDTEFRFNQKLLGFRPRAGIYYAPNEGYSLGAFAAPAVKIDVDQDLEYWGLDTVAVTEAQMEFPATLGIGIRFPLSAKALGVVDFLWTGWHGEEQVIGNPAGYHESQYFAFGTEFYPSTDPLAPLYKRTAFRLGVNYRNLYYQVPPGETVEEYSLNLGAGIPLKAGFGRMDLSLSFGKRGDLSKNGGEELFFRFGIYISTGEKWFVRKKKY